MKTLIAVLIAAGMAHGQTLMPLPAKAEFGAGRLPITAAFSVSTTGVDDPRVKAVAIRLVARLVRQTGMPLDPGASSHSPTLTLHCEHRGEAVQKLGEDESYRLEITAAQARISAANALGVLRGVETFLQLVSADGEGFSVPAGVIEDHPRFAWRGLLIDVSRHWMPLDVIYRNLDAMAAVKLNVLHWHLSDDQGFRVESKRYPKLHELGSDGHYYTQDQVREVIAYARERGTRVVPEFDMPAHSTSWLVGYPELAAAPGPYEIGRHWGVFTPVLDPSKEIVYTFLDGFIGEMARLFPDEYFHIGGDEVNGKQWTASAQLTTFKQRHDLKDNHALQAYFNRRIQAIVAKHGKRMEGWDEILDPDLPKNIVIQSWRGSKSLAEAVKLGYQGILSSGYYLDLMQPASEHYAVDPLDQESANLTVAEQARILGGEACMWAEYVTPENIDSRLWPRAGAVAERLWSPGDARDASSMYARLETLSRRLEWLGLQHRQSYRTMLERLAGDSPVQPLEILAEAVEPVKRYARARSAKYTQQTPLNHLVDAVPPESAKAREFSALVDAANHAELRARLIAWRDNDAKLQPMLNRSFLLKELVPLSADLATLAATGLRALDYLDQHQRAPEQWVKEQKAFIENAKKPRAALLLIIAPSIEKLVNATAAR
jgi:hexosaminidase